MLRKTRTSAELFALVAGPPTLGFKKLFDRFLHLLTLTDTSLAEVCSSWTLIGIGVVLLLPSTALDGNIPLFTLMLRVMPEHPAWSITFLALGLFQTAANIRRHVGARRYAAFIAFFVFTVVGALGMTTKPAVLILGVMFLIHAFVQGIVFLQLRVHGEHGAK